MTLRYAKIANLTVADEYFAVTDKVEAPYGRQEPLPADALGAKMARLRRDHFRMLGNGYCARPPELDCSFESVCENCTFFQTSIQFRPTLQAQHDDAAAKPDRTPRQPRNRNNRTTSHGAGPAPTAWAAACRDRRSRRRMTSPARVR